MSFKYERFLIEAVEQCHLQRILTCIKHGHNIHIQNNLGQSLLIHLLKQENAQDPFFEKKRFQVFQFLITHCKLGIHTFDNYGKNLFNWTTNLNRTTEALYLLRSYPGDIDILIRDQLGLCSLHYAIEHGNTILVHAIVEYLLQYRMRFDIKDNHNNTPEELARKLGYDDIADYLSETCRSTVFMSREIPLIQQRIMTNKSKLTRNTKSSGTTLTLSTGTSILDSSELYNLIESKIELARNLNDWKTVAALRSHKRNSNTKKTNQLPIPILQINKPASSSSIAPVPPLPKLPPINNRSRTGQSAQMLHLIEPQISSSYRQAFVPYYARPFVPTVDLPSTVAQRKMSVVSSRRMSSVMSIRKRESNASQLGGLITQDGQNRLSLPQGFNKQHRQSIVASRLSDGDALAKLRSKNLITAHN